MLTFLMIAGTLALALGAAGYIPMPDASMILEAGTTQTATHSSAWFDLGNKFTAGGLGDAIAAIVEVTARDHTTGDETYTFKLQETGPDSSGVAIDGNAVDIGVAVAVAGAGVGQYIAKGLVTNRFIRLTMTAGGTTPSITYSALAGK